MDRNCEILYDRLKSFAELYRNGLVSKNDLTNELGYFVLYKVNQTVNPYIEQIENNIERVVLNGR